MTTTRILTAAVAVTFILGGAAAQGDDKAEKKEEKKAAKEEKKEEKKMAEHGGMQMPPMPKPAPEFEAFAKVMAGNWKCDSVMPAGAMGPGSPEMKMASMVKMKKDLDGFWLTGTWEVKKTKAMPGMKGNIAMGSPDGKQLVMLTADSMGSSGYTSGPLGADGGTLTGEGIMMGNKVKIRETVQKRSDKEVFHKIEVDMGKGFMSAAEDTCKK